MKFPSSKSYTQRALICALLAQKEGGVSTLVGIDFSGDERSALRAIQSLGAECQVLPNGDVEVGAAKNLCGGTVNIGESGFLARSIPFVGAMTQGGITLRGEGTLPSRPLGAVKEMLEKLGKECTGDKVPLVIEGGGIMGGREIVFDGTHGSQTLTGVLLAAPLMRDGLQIKVDNLKSQKYVDMTLEVMHAFGVEVLRSGYDRFEIPAESAYSATRYGVEGDWSAASYFLVAGRMWGKDVNPENLNMQSLQADRAIMKVLEMSCGGRAIEFDATHCPDLFTAIVPLCATLSGVSRIRGVNRLSTKESDRGVVLQREFAKFGVEIRLLGDVMEIEGSGGGMMNFTQSAPIDPAGDHRIAMATAIMARRVEVMEPEVVDKSFSDFFVRLEEFFAL